MARNASDRQPRLSMDRILVLALAFTLFAVPLFAWPTITDYFLTKTAAMLCLIAVVCVLWAVRMWAAGALNLRLPWILSAFGLFTLAALLSLLTAVNLREVFQGLFVGLFLLLLFLAIANVVRRKQDFDLLLFALLFAGFGAGVSALLNKAGLVRFATGFGLTSTLGLYNYLGGYVAYLIPPSLLLLLGRRSILFRVATAFMLLFLGAIAVLVDQLGILLALVAASAIGLLPAAAARRKGIRTWRQHASILIGIMVLATGVVAFRVGSTLVRNLSRDQATPTQQEAMDVESRSQSGDLAPTFPSVVSSTALGVVEGNNLWARLLFSTVGLRMLKEQPLTGVGLGNYKILYTQYEARVRLAAEASVYPDVIYRPEHAHNDYIQVASELGALGILTLLLFFGLLYAAVRSRCWAPRTDARRYMTESLLLTTGILVVLIHALVSFPTHLPASLLVSTTLLGLLLCPVCGNANVSIVHIGKRTARVLAASLVVVASVAIIFAAREVTGHRFLNQGLEDLYLGKPSDAVSALSKSVELTFSPRSARYYLGIAQARVGEYESALINLEKSLSSITADIVYLVYADLASQLGHIDAAREAITILVSSNPSWDMKLRAWYIEAQVERLGGDQERALDLLESLLESDPRHVQAHIARAEVLCELTWFSEARAEYEEALVIIDEETEALQRSLSASSDTSLAEYGDVTAEISFLRNERGRILKALQSLPEEPSQSR